MNEEKNVREARPRSLNRHMLHGSIWMVLLRWGIRLTGLLSTLVLARLLVPADFGIVAMAMFVVNLLELLNQSGQKLAIIRHANPTRADFDTAWTLSVIVAVIIALLIWVSAPIAVTYFHEPRVKPVLEWLSLRSFLSGFENIGIIQFRRDLQFNWFFLYNICSKIISLVVTIVAAVLWRNYWALVAGIITAQLARNVMSFVIHPYRPGFSLSKLSEMGSFSAWTLVKETGVYLNQQVDQIAVGGMSGSSAMGRYAVASDLASSPSTEINTPMLAVLYPVMSKVRSDAAALRRLYLNTFGWSAIICLSASVGVMMIAHDLVRFALGDRWLDVEPLMGWLAIGTGLLGLSSGAYATFDAIGKPDLGAKMQWTRLIFLTVALVPICLILKSMSAVVIGRLVMIAVFIPTLLFTIGHEINVSPKDYVRALWRPTAASFVMAIALLMSNVWLSPSNIRLFFDVVLGVVMFASSLLFLWAISGKPQGPEKDILEAMVGLLCRLWEGSLKLLGKPANSSSSL